MVVPLGDAMDRHWSTLPALCQREGLVLVGFVGIGGLGLRRLVPLQLLHRLRLALWAAFHDLGPAHGRHRWLAHAGRVDVVAFMARHARHPDRHRHLHFGAWRREP